MEIISCAQIDNVSQLLQITRMTFVEEKTLEDSVVMLFRAMRVDEKFDLFHNKFLGHSTSDLGELNHQGTEKTIITFK